MWGFFALLLLHRVNAEECANPLNTERHASSTEPRPPHSTTALADIIGLEDAKEVLREAVVLPSSMDPSTARLFGHSSERSAVLLVGPAGLGKVAAAEAAAASAGALVLLLPAREVASSGFCRTSSAAVASQKKPVVVVIEGLENAPSSASMAIQQCLREVADNRDTHSRVFVVATMANELASASATALGPFGYVVQLGLPSDAERKQFLLHLLQQISRIDSQWASALREEVVTTLTSLMAKYTFGEMELVVKRAFIRSTNAEGGRDPVALHHFEKILGLMQPTAADAFSEVQAAFEPSAAAAGGGTVKSTAEKKKKSESKDPMDGIFGWCNFWLPEAVQLPPVVWAMIIFGILAHFVARSTYQPYGSRKRRGGAGGAGGPGGSLFGDIGGKGGAGGGAGMPAGFPSFGDSMNDLGFAGGAGGSPFGNFPPPPGMPGMPGMGRAGGLGAGADMGSTPSTSSSGMPTAGKPTVGGPPAH